MEFLRLDLNRKGRFCDPAKHDFARTIAEPRPTGVRATDAASSADHVSLPSSRQLLCHPRQIESQGATAPFALGRSNHGSDLRPDPGAHWLLLVQGLRRPTATHSLQGSPDRQNTDLPDQQLHLAAAHDHGPLSLPLAVELFFKWQHLRIKAFFGTSENAVKSQIWIAVSVYVLVAIVKKRL